MEEAGTIWVTLDQLRRLEHFASNTMVVPHRTIRSLLSGRHPSAMRGRGLDFEEVRTYVRGDDIRNIDWRVTARTQTTHTKVFNEERERPVFVVLDMSSTMFIGTRMYMKSVIAAQLSAVLGFSILGRGDRFGGLVFTDDAEEMIRPIRHRPALQRFLRTVADYSAALKDTTRIGTPMIRMRQILKRIPSLITHDYIVHVITDFTEFTREDYRLLMPIKRKNDIVLTHIEDPVDCTLPDQKIVWTDGDRQVEVSPDATHSGTWTRAYDAFLKTFKEQYTRYQIPTMVFKTDRPMEEQVKSMLGTLINR